LYYDYILILLLIIQGQFIKDRKVLVFLSFIELVFIAGFRLPVLDVGSDTEWYYYKYLDFKSYKLSYFDHYYNEIGFDFFCYILSKINSHPQFLLFATQVFMTFSILNLVKKKSALPWLSIVFYVTFLFYFNAMNLMRFYLALSVLCFSIDSIINRNLVKFTVIVIIAFLFHFSAISFFVVYFIYPLKLTFRRIIMLSIPFLLITMFLMPLFSLLTSINGKYMGYAVDGEFYSSSFANILFFLINLFCLYFIVKKTSVKITDYKDEDKLFFICFLLGTFFSAIGIKVMIAIRFMMLFSLFEIILLPTILYSLPPKNRRIWTLFWLLLTIGQVFVILLYRPEWYAITPYRNFIFS